MATVASLNEAAVTLFDGLEAKARVKQGAKFDTGEPFRYQNDRNPNDHTSGYG